MEIIKYSSVARRISRGRAMSGYQSNEKEFMVHPARVHPHHMVHPHMVHSWYILTTEHGGGWPQKITYCLLPSNKVLTPAEVISWSRMGG